MKTSFLRIPVFVFAAILLVVGCNKETYLESIGKVTLESGDNAEVGYFIFTSKTAVGTCGKVTLWIDDKVVGYLTADYTGGVASCTTPPIEGKLVKIVAPTGTHKIRCTVENNCRRYNEDTYVLKQGICRYYGLN